MEYLSKSKFKPKALEVMRQVENTGKAVVITDRGNPVLELRPYRADRTQEESATYLKGSVLQYIDPTEPIADGDWDAGL